MINKSTYIVNTIRYLLQLWRSRNLVLRVSADNECNKSLPNWSKTTQTIRRTAVREAGVSRQSCVPNLGHPLNPLGPSHHSILLRGLREALNWLSIMPKDDSLSRTANVIFFQSDTLVDVFLLAVREAQVSLRPTWGTPLNPSVPYLMLNLIIHQLVTHREIFSKSC